MSYIFLKQKVDSETKISDDKSMSNAFDQLSAENSEHSLATIQAWEMPNEQPQPQPQPYISAEAWERAAERSW